MDGPSIVQGLIARGYTPIQAAALGGHMLQESGGDPSNVNQKEDAHGLLQWRGDRWGNLQKMAKDRGLSPTDPNVQLDFIGHELGTSEASAGKAFYGAGDDLGAASSALKRYIRFGDNSDTTRLNNARGLLGMPGISAQAGMIGPQATSALPPSTAASPAAGSTPQPGAPAAAPDDGNAAFMASLQNIPKLLQQQQANQSLAPAPVIPSNIQARIAAIAAARQLGQTS
jgi:hypothetical protein